MDSFACVHLIFDSTIQFCCSRSHWEQWHVNSFGGTISKRWCVCYLANCPLSIATTGKLLGKLMFCNSVISHVPLLDLFCKMTSFTAMNINHLQALFRYIHKVVPDDMECIWFWIWCKLPEISWNLCYIDCMRGLFKLWPEEMMQVWKISWMLQLL
jgi:hypothetical protein